MQNEGCAGIYEIAHVFRDDAPDKTHLREFTMIEWYTKNYSCLNMMNDITDLLASLDHAGIDEKKDRNRFESYAVFSVAEIFNIAYGVWPTSGWSFEDYFEVAKNHKIIHNPAAVVSKLHKEHLQMEVFSILYDHAIQKYFKDRSELLFIKDYPPFLRGMAELSNEGWAMRFEGYLSGLEICSGYQEMSDSSELENVWNHNNEIRSFLGKKPHPVDLELIEVSRHMAGVAGMALGLERSLMALHNIPDIQSFKLYRF